MNIPAGWHIQYNSKPIPLRGHDWDYWHDEVDNDSRLTGTAGSEEEAKLAIMEKQAERCGFDKSADIPDDDDAHINIESLQYIIADMQRDLMARDKRVAELEAENAALRERLARMPVLKGYANDWILDRINQFTNTGVGALISPNKTKYYNVPIYIDPPEQETQG